MRPAGYRFLTRLLPLALAWGMALAGATAALRTKWLLFPLSSQLIGVQFGFGPYVPGAQHARLASFGVAAAGLLLAGALFFTLRWWRWLGWTGALLLWLAVLAPLKVAMLDPILLQTLSVETAQSQLATIFSVQALPVNYGSEPSVSTRIDTSTIEDRLVAAWYYAHAGWWAPLLGGVLALCCRPRRVVILSAWTGVAGITVLCVLRPALGEMALMRAHRAEALGQADDAERHYRQAMRIDPWLGFNINIHSALGCLDDARGRRDTPEFHLYHAQLPSTQVDLTAALGELEGIHGAGLPLARVIRRREAELYTQYARQLHALDAYAAAVSAAENALERDPASLLARFYLCRDLGLIGRYNDAADASLRLARDVDAPSFRADAFSDAGDALTKLGRYAEARDAYRLSYKYDYVLNLRALAALNGPGEDMQ